MKSKGLAKIMQRIPVIIFYIVLVSKKPVMILWVLFCCSKFVTLSW